MDEARLLRLQRAVDAVHTTEHPMVVFSLESLRRFGRLPPHEEVRGDLVFLDFGLMSRVDADICEAFAAV